MKKIGSILFLIVSQIFFAQSTRFVYEVTMKPDSTNKNDIKTELAYLDVSGDQSIFYGAKRLSRDSVMQKMRMGGSFDRSQMSNLRSNINYIVEKNSKEHKVYFKDRIGRDQYTYEEDRSIDWKILPDTQKIGEYKAQKAEAEFAGRKWTAWFTQDIPFQDGPYKFSGLPGLILKVEDSAGDYSFDLKETKKIAESASFPTRGNVVKIKRTAFEKQYQKYLKDPMTFLQISGNVGAAPAPPSPNGTVVIRGGFRPENAADRKAMEERILKEIRAHNNPIER